MLKSKSSQSRKGFISGYISTYSLKPQQWLTSNFSLRLLKDRLKRASCVLMRGQNLSTNIAQMCKSRLGELICGLTTYLLLVINSQARQNLEKLLSNVKGDSIELENKLQVHALLLVRCEWCFLRLPLLMVNRFYITEKRWNFAKWHLQVN